MSCYQVYKSVQWWQLMKLRQRLPDFLLCSDEGLTLNEMTTSHYSPFQIATYNTFWYHFIDSANSLGSDTIHTAISCSCTCAHPREKNDLYGRSGRVHVDELILTNVVSVADKHAKLILIAQTRDVYNQGRLKVDFDWCEDDLPTGMQGICGMLLYWNARQGGHCRCKCKNR